jgi:hypothetical protein
MASRTFFGFTGFLEDADPQRLVAVEFSWERMERRWLTA